MQRQHSSKSKKSKLKTDLAESWHRLRFVLGTIIAGGILVRYEGCDKAGKWHGGYSILSEGAYVAHKITFRTGAEVKVHTRMEDVIMTEK